MVSALSAGFAACTTFGSSASDGGIEPSSDAQADTSVTIPSEAGALDASLADAVPPGARSWKAFFVTEGKITGDLTGEATGGTDPVPFTKADELCGLEARTARLSGQFLALVRSEKNANLADRVKSSTGRRYLPGGGQAPGALVVSDIASTAVALVAAPNRHASGAVVELTTRVWTGGASATAVPALCSTTLAPPWTLGLAGAFGTVGDPSQTDGSSVDFGNVECNRPQSLYCVEK